MDTPLAIANPTDERAGDTVIRGACPHDCPDCCAILGTIRDGRAIRVAGHPNHHLSPAFLFAKGNRYLPPTYHSYRLMHTLRPPGT